MSADEEHTASPIVIRESNFTLSEKRGIRILESSPESVIFHKVTDDELDKLTMADQSSLANWATTLIGAGAGLVQNIFGVILGLNATPPKLPSALELIGCGLSVGFLCVGITLWFTSRKLQAPASTLKDSIRSRRLTETGQA